ncbi:Alpha/Beta hydrolase protein [Phaeosphaeriaceae sp. PMI808]|nr:Alpha/Beta hydrolase protein [Phaeosphaeriaceae sp. PMI808]
MANLDDTTGDHRFDSFHTYTTPYKTIGTHNIDVAILVPKNLKPVTKHPIFVKFHGGGLVTGTALYPNWTAAYYIPLLHAASAILIAPNYRLLPEHTGADIASDLAAFWSWIHASGPTLALRSLHPDVLPLDYARVLVADAIRAVMATYPMTAALRADKDGVLPDILSGNAVPGPEFIEEHLAGVEEGGVVSSAVPPERVGLSLALSMSGRYLDYFGDDDMLWPLRRIEGARRVPDTWIVHGEEDMIVSVKDSREFVERWRKNVVEGEVRLDVRPGDHGFDIDMKASEQPWLKDGLDWLVEKWLG